MEAGIVGKLGLSFLVGGAFVALATVLADRFGSRVGGVVGGLPSTVVVALLFIGWIRGPETAAAAATLVPLAISFTGPFFVVYALAAKAGLALALSLALGSWFALSAVTFVSGLHDFGLSLLGWILISLASFWILEKVLKVRSKARPAAAFSLRQALGRGLFGGTVILCAVLMSEVGGPFLGGIFSCFPAVFLSTLTVVHRARGPAFSVAVAKSLMVSGMINVALYGIAVRSLYPAAGVWYGTLLALAVACTSGWATLRFVAPRLS